MRAARLQTYWKKVCEDERKARQRNDRLLKDIERIDIHMTDMNSRTQRLALMKKQYEDHIGRTYPKWNSLMTEKETNPEVCEQKGSKIEPEATEITVKEDSPNKYVQPANESQSNIDTLQIRRPSSEGDDYKNKQSSNFKTEAPKENRFSNTEKKEESHIYANIPSARSDLNERDDRNYDVMTRGDPLHGNKQTKADNQEEQEDETSDFGSDIEIPMGRSMLATQIPADNRRSSRGDEEQSKYAGTIEPELTVNGLTNLLSRIEEEISTSKSVQGYYRSSWPSEKTRMEIIKNANTDKSLSLIEGNTASMVVLEQLPLIVRNLEDKSLFPDEFFEEDVLDLTYFKVRLYLSRDAGAIWELLFLHFSKLVKNNVIEPHELSAIFTPSLIMNPRDQEKCHAMIVNLLENSSEQPESKLGATNEGNPVSPAMTLEGSGSLVDDGKVPPLKFGSLLEKTFSDEDSSYVNSSLPRDPTPLNETAAYKNMLLNSGSFGRRQSTQEDTDDDVEKQLATAVLNQKSTHQEQQKKTVTPKDEPSETSSQTMPTHPHVYVPTAFDNTRQINNQTVTTQNKFQGVKISSDLDTDTEVDAGIFGTSKQKTVDSDFDFYD